MKLLKQDDGFLPSLWNSFYHDDFFTLPSRMNSVLPAINIIDREDDFLVQMAVPGMKKEDFKIDLENNLLSISTEAKTEHEVSEWNYTRKEFSYYGFSRSFSLPDIIDGEKISATYTDGVLGITIPKKEEAKSKPPISIEIA
jgi:HSP20 family protein